MHSSNQSGTINWAKRKGCSMKIKSKRSRETIIKASRKETPESTSWKRPSIKSSTLSWYTTQTMPRLVKVKITKTRQVELLTNPNILALCSTTSWNHLVRSSSCQHTDSSERRWCHSSKDLNHVSIAREDMRLCITCGRSCMMSTSLLTFWCHELIARSLCI